MVRLCLLKVKAKSLLSTMGLRDDERAAWGDLLKRLEFFVRAFEGDDARLARLSAKKLGKSIEIHGPLYKSRMTSEFNGPF